MMLAESVTLAVVAGAASICLRYAVPTLLRHMLFSSGTPFYDTAPHASALVYLAVVTLGAGLLAGWVPAAESFKQQLTAALKDEDAASAAARGRWGARDVLVGVQVALSTVLVVGAALFVRAHHSMATSDRGFDTEHTLLLPLGTRPLTIAEGVRALPAVRGVALASTFGGGDEGGDE